MNIYYHIKKIDIYSKYILRTFFFSLKNNLYIFFPRFVSPVHIYQKKKLIDLQTESDIYYFKFINSSYLNNRDDTILFSGKRPINKRRYFNKEIGVFKLSSANIYSEKAIAVSSTDYIFAHTYLIPENRNIINFDNTLFREIRRKHVSTILDYGFLLSTEGTNGYYHWIIDAIPKLSLLSNENIEGEPVVVISESNKTFVNESLSFYGIKNYVVFKKNLNFSISTLYVPEMISDVDGYPLFDSLSFLRSRLHLINIYNCSFSKKIYISRRNQKIRRILNENELVNLIKDYGFETFILEEMTFINQIQLFSNADIVLSPHGAGLTNIVYCRKEAIIMELFPANYFEQCYQNISNLLGFRHFLNIENNGDQNYNFRVNIDNLKQMFDSIV